MIGRGAPKGGGNWAPSMRGVGPDPANDAVASSTAIPPKAPRYLDFIEVSPCHGVGGLQHGTVATTRFKAGSPARPCGSAQISYWWRPNNNEWDLVPSSSRHVPQDLGKCHAAARAEPATLGDGDGVRGAGARRRARA